MRRIFSFSVALFVLVIAFSLSTGAKASSWPIPSLPKTSPKAKTCHICAACAGLCANPDRPFGIVPPGMKFDRKICAVIYCAMIHDVGLPRMDIWRKISDSSPVILTPALELQLQEVGKPWNRPYIPGGMMEGFVPPDDFDYALRTWRSLRPRFPSILDYPSFGGFFGNEKKCLTPQPSFATILKYKLKVARVGLSW